MGTGPDRSYITKYSRLSDSTYTDNQHMPNLVRSALMYGTERHILSNYTAQCRKRMENKVQPRTVPASPDLIRTITAARLE